MGIYQGMLGVHVVAGCLALILFWGAASARKGSELHRRIGRWYMLAMLGVVVSALYLCLEFWLRGRTGIATFLGYLVIITTMAMASAWRAVRWKRSREHYFGTPFKVMALLSLVSGLAVLSLGLVIRNPLLIGFSWVGILAGIGMLQQLRRLPMDPKWWLREHYGGILGCGVATHIAFLSIGLNRLLQPFGVQAPEMLAWMLPLVVMVLVRVRLDRKHAPKPTPSPVAAAPQAG